MLGVSENTSEKWSVKLTFCSRYKSIYSGLEFVMETEIGLWRIFVGISFAKYQMCPKFPVFDLEHSNNTCKSDFLIKVGNLTSEKVECAVCLDKFCTRAYQ